MRLCFQIPVKIMGVVLSLWLSHGVPFQSLCLGIVQKTANQGGGRLQFSVWNKAWFLFKMSEEQKIWKGQKSAQAPIVKSCLAVWTCSMSLQMVTALLCYLHVLLWLSCPQQWNKGGQRSEPEHFLIKRTSWIMQLTKAKQERDSLKGLCIWRLGLFIVRFADYLFHLQSWLPWQWV